MLAILGDGLCLDRALLVIALLTNERQARQHLRSGPTALRGMAHTPDLRALQNSCQLPLPCLLKAVVGTSNKTCCRKHAHQSYDPRGRIATCIQLAHARLLKEPRALPADHNETMQAFLLDALNVKVWVSCVRDSFQEGDSLSGPIATSAQPLAGVVR